MMIVNQYHEEVLEYHVSLKISPQNLIHGRYSVRFFVVTMMKSILQYEDDIWASTISLLPGFNCTYHNTILYIHSHGTTNVVDTGAVE